MTTRTAFALGAVSMLGLLAGLAAWLAGQHEGAY